MESPYNGTPQDIQNCPLNMGIILQGNTFVTAICPQNIKSY